MGKLPVRTVSRSLLAIIVIAQFVMPIANAQLGSVTETEGFGGSPPKPGGFHSWWQGDDREVFREALALAGLTAEEFNLPREQVAVWGGDRYRLPRFDLFFENTWAISPFTHRSAETIIGRADRPLDLAYIVQAPTGFRVRDSSYSSWVAATTDRVVSDEDMALANALASVSDRSAEEIAQVHGYSDVPLEVNRAAAMLVHQFAQAERFREIGLVEPIESLGLDPQRVYDDMYASVFFGRTLDDAAPDQPEELLRKAMDTDRIINAVDFNTIYRGANAVMIGVQFALDEFAGENEKKRRIEAFREAAPKDEAGEITDAEALEQQIAEVEATDLIAQLSNREFSFMFRTKLGWVRLNGAGSHDYAGREHDLLVIDTGGNDNYEKTASTSDFSKSIAVTIDLAGNDQYQSPDFADWDEYSKRVDGRSDEFEYHNPDDHTPSFGAAVCGYAALIDLSGDDRYASTFVGQGTAVLGFAMLYDNAGNDTYLGDTMLQGAAYLGAAALVDRAGDDLYLCFFQAQGYAGTLGSGLILDTAGDDRYHAVNSMSKEEFGYTVKYAWFNDYPDSLSKAQGYAHGRRADMSDGHSRAGGIGTLIDAGGGNDTYEADVFCQGSSYWYSLGTLYDDGGNDSYTTSTYGIASPVHFTVGVLIDVDGDDVYRAHSKHGCGFARDFSIGWFEDGGGNDTYYGNTSAFGVGNVNSLGVFWDRGGDDNYYAHNESFGQPTIGNTGSIRDVIINAGMFIDAGGLDNYYTVTEEMVARDQWPFNFAKSEDLDQFTLVYHQRRQTMSDKAQMSWHGLHTGSPGSTGAAIDRN
ncbi:MAG: hypothetical protein AAGB34_08890 [Planctomycetota bacterium]